MSVGRPRVLLVRLSSLGDVVLATAALEALREDVPGAAVDVLTKPAFREVFAANPAVAGVCQWDPTLGVAALARDLRREQYDWVVDLHGNLRTRLLRVALRGPRWSVYGKGSGRRRVAVALRRPGLLDGRHVVDRYIEALGPLGVRPVRRLPRVHPRSGDREAAARRLAEAGWDGSSPVVALAPGARWNTKAWPPGHWATLIRALGAEKLAFPALLGGPEEEGLCGSILEESRGLGANLAGRTSILGTAAVLELSRVLVTNDSAPLHLATAVGTPVVALFGPTVRGFGFYPLGPRDEVVEADVACRPCSLHGRASCRQGFHRCLAELKPALVLDALGRAGSLLSRP